MTPMYMPAEIHRRIDSGTEIMVARGPLVIMAYGLLAIAPEDRKGCWIKSADGRMNAEEAEAALRMWHGRAAEFPKERRATGTPSLQ